MNSVARAVFRALISLLHRSMLWLAVWPFLLALCVWGVVGWTWRSTFLPLLHDALFGLTLINWVEGSLRWLHLGGLLEFLVPLMYLVLLLCLTVATALVILGLLAMPIVVDHVAARHHPTLERRHGAGTLHSLLNSSFALLIFLIGWVATMPLWLMPPLGALVSWCLWGWLSYRVFSFDALAAHASEAERDQLRAQERPRLIALGMLVGALNFVPPLFFLAPIYGGLVFTHFSLEALERLRRQPGPRDRPAGEAVGHMTLETSS